MKTYDEVSAQLSEKQSEQEETRHKACVAIEKAEALLATLDAQLAPLMGELDVLETERQKILAPWAYTGGRRAHRFLFAVPKPRIRDSRAWARAVGQQTRIWTVALRARDESFMEIETTRETDLAGWDELLRQADEKLVSFGYILLHSDEDVKEALRHYWPSKELA
jgi:hypothetical protein